MKILSENMKEVFKVKDGSLRAFLFYLVKSTLVKLKLLCEIFPLKPLNMNQLMFVDAAKVDL